MAHCQWTQERVKLLRETSDRAFYTLKCDQGRSFLRLFMRSTAATGKYDENELLVSCYDIRSWFTMFGKEIFISEMSQKDNWNENKFMT